MIVPYLIGLYLLFDQVKKNSNKFVILLLFVSIIPASLSGSFISIQRALPFLLPLAIVIGLGIDYFVKKLPTVVNIGVFSVVALFSLLMLYRSYFVLFPKEKAIAWNYGYADLANFIKQSPEEHFLIDNSRNQGLFMELLFFLKYPPEEFQKEVGSFIKNNYYKAPIIDGNFSFANIDARGIIWEKDIYKDQIIIGDSLSISDGQEREHVLTKVYQLKDPLGNIVFNGYRTNPKEKCKQELLLKKIQSQYCFSR